MSSSDQEDNNSENGSQNNKGPSLTQEVKVDDCIKVSFPLPPSFEDA